MQRSLGLVPDDWNKLADFKTARSYVERELDRFVCRQSMATLKSSELRAYLFVKSRTLGWQKYAEAIPMSHFTAGLRDSDGELVRDPQGGYLCVGAGIAKEDTVRAALDSLQRRGLLTIFRAAPGSGRANVYMPVSLNALASFYIAGGGPILPDSYPQIVPGEHVVAHDRMWQIKDALDGAAMLQRAVDGRKVGAETVTLDHSEFRRPSVYEWNRFSRRENFYEN